MRVATCIGDRHILVKSNKRRVQQHSLHVFCDHAMVRSFNPRFVLVDCGGGRQDEINLFFFVPVQRFTWMHISIQSKHCKDCFCNSQVSFHCTSYHLDVPSQFKRSWNGKEVGGGGRESNIAPSLWLISVILRQNKVIFGTDFFWLKQRLKKKHHPTFPHTECNDSYPLQKQAYRSQNSSRISICPCLENMASC